MGTDELFKKRRAARKKRQHDIRTPQANSYLIITEGTRTEPFYFKGLQKLIQETIGGTIQELTSAWSIIIESHCTWA